MPDVPVPSAPESRPRKGTKTKLFGVLVLMVGGLDCMLSWRGGFVVSEFYLVLLGAGAVLYCAGAIRAAGSPARADSRISQPHRPCRPPVAAPRRDH